jgi:hypothetical protein
MRTTAAQEAIAAAWAAWLEQHDVSVPELVRAAIEAAATRWLDQHSDELIAAIARSRSLNEGSEPWPSN